MKKTFLILTLAVFLLFLLSLAVYHYGGKIDFWKTISITLGVTAYHFVMRLAIGYLVARHEYNAYSSWFHERKFERMLYGILRVKKWKGHLPTYNPALFDIKKRSIASIIESTCQAELCHEAIMVFSLMPIFLIRAFGASGVFISTSIIAALADGLFVIVQRYNRPRLIVLDKHLEKGKQS